MKTTPTTAPRRDTLNLRIAATERNLIDRAAEAVGKTRTDFILEAVRREAENTLLERALFAVGEDAYAAFLNRLDAPVQPNARLRRTLQTPPPWVKP